MINMSDRLKVSPEIIGKLGLFTAGLVAVGIGSLFSLSQGGSYAEGRIGDFLRDWTDADTRTINSAVDRLANRRDGAPSIPSDPDKLRQLGEYIDASLPHDLGVRKKPGAVINRLITEGLELLG
ncbi:hypothetical protein A3F58_01335 [Candidatus Roizmanbacteria bacterium RIFCSPHIGHO2_12_FULL_37_9b]|uniref:Uncharacterized protein n=1 Tax=Candidatus Roizmanbacteria bacterium RIFCSPHIGHO2_02_FULL_38_11 TaxID=1802039 RepID=A0A1F7H459_9BACT|nr:MAG: hypothetical protein A3C25_04080 [Candidatus Roizmanbacteria bacterium RIFCSPHIGHO2_02_FULL_38_11]OGK33841.1 MAG: hypothetical protein A3F58_01335 [Candidatus Roizmanbacteria bacterium RIFCSPHIGHO2_12_FULL_37_9b]